MVRRQGGDDTGERAALILTALERMVEQIPSRRVFSSRERCSLDDTLAILTFRSGAERRQDPPATLVMIQTALRALRCTEWMDVELSLWSLGGHPKPAINRHRKTGN